MVDETEQNDKTKGLEKLWDEKPPCLHPEPKPEPPKLKDGDYGIDDANQSWLHLDGKTYWIDSGVCTSAHPDSYFMKFPHRNLVQDLARNKVDLTVWDSGIGRGKSGAQDYKITMQCYDDGSFWLGTSGYATWYTLDQATEIHQKLGQMLATAKRKSK